MTEDKVVGWHHQLNGHEFEQAPGVSDGHGSLACCSSWGWKELDMTATELTDCKKELIIVVTTRGSWEDREQKGTGQKVQTSSYKISTRNVMYNKITIANTAI